MNGLLRYFESRLQRRLVGIFIPLVVIPLILIALFLGNQLYQTLTSAQDASEESQIFRQLDEIEEYTEGLATDIQLLASLPTVTAYAELLVDPRAERNALAAAKALAQSEFLAFSGVRDNYHKIRLIDVGGRERIRIDNPGDGSTPFPVVENGLQFKGDRDYFENTLRLPEGDIYVSQLDLNREGTPPEIEVREDGSVLPVIRYAMPVYVTSPATGREELAGIVVTSAFAAPVFEIIREEASAEEYNLMINADGYFLYSNLEGAAIFGFEPGIASVLPGSIEGDAARIQVILPEYASQLLNARNLFEFDADIESEQHFEATIGDFTALTHYTRIQPAGATPDNYWVLINAQSEASLFGQLQALVTAGAMALIVIILIVAFIVNAFARTVTVPLARLGEQANRMATGDLSAEAADSTLAARPDEVGTLGKAFSTMSAQLKDLLASMESRVTARTADLQTASDIASAANQVREQADLISLTVNLIRDRFNFYYVQVYLLDDEGNFAVLKDGTGYVGRRLLARQHRLSMEGVSLVAKSIHEGKPVIVQDTTRDPNFRPNDLLPDTRAELVVPLRSRDVVIGVLDIQHNVSNAFDPDTLRLFQTLAEQLAVTFENVKLFEYTERRARQLETVALVGIEATRSLDVKALLRSVSKLTRDNFGLYHAHIYLLDDSQTRLVLTAGAGEAGSQMMEQGHQIPLEHEISIVARAARTGEAVVVNDTRDDVNFLPNPLLPNTQSEMAVPMVVGNQVIGVLDVQSNTVNRFDEEDIRVQTTLASQVAVAVQNARTFVEVQQAQKETERLFTSTLDLLGSANFDGYFTRLNPAWEATIGYSPEELMASPFVSFVHPDDVEKTSAETAKIADGVTALSFENRYRCKDGSYKWISWNATPDVEAGLIHFVARDITGAKAAAEEEHLLFTIANRLNNAHSPQEILDAVADYSFRKNASSATLLYLDNDVEGNPEWATVVGAAEHDGAPGATPPGTRYYLPELPFTKLWTSSPDNPLMIEDIKTSPMIDEVVRPLFELTGLNATIIIPLRADTGWQGMLSMSWKESHVFSDEEQRMFRLIQRQALPVVESVRAADQVRRRVNELETVTILSVASTSQLNVDDLLRTVASLTKSSFNRYHAHIYLLDAAGENLVLAAGAGIVGMQMVENHHSIPLEREDSIVASAARHSRPVIVDDVTRAASFLPNELLPDTRSEMAIPILYAETLLGVLDIQDDKPGAFDYNDEQIQTTLANQIAVAIQNARAFEDVQAAQKESERIFSSTLDLLGSANFDGYFTRLNPAWELTLGWSRDELMAAPFISFVHPEDVEKTNSEAGRLAAGASSIFFENRYRCADDSYRWISWNVSPDMEAGLLHFVARDVTAAKAAAEEERLIFMMADRLNNAHSPVEIADVVAAYALERDADSISVMYLDNDAKGSPEWATIVGVYDRGAVPTAPLGTRFYLPELPFATLWMSSPDAPLLVEDTRISELVDETTRVLFEQFGLVSTAIIPLRTEEKWQGLISISWNSPHSFSESERRIYRAIQQQTTPVIDSVRAGEQIRRRAAELETVARVSAAATTILKVDDLLKSVVELTRASFDLYHVHIYLLDEESQSLTLAAGAGEAGKIMKARGHRISIDQPASLVARAARSQQSVIVNDVTRAPDFLPNELLPNTRSELAVPMVVGDVLVGVLDVQSNVTNHFTEDDSRIQNMLADQVAVAVLNAQAFERERRTVERLKEVDRLKQEFLANMSHELRTPLNSIIGYSEVLKDGVDGELTEDAQEDVDAIYNSGRHLLTIINEILDMAKIEAGQMQLNQKAMSLSELLHEVVHDSQILVKDKPVEMRLVEDSPIGQVNGDRVRLKQIMLNLISNAVKFTEEGGITVRYGMASPDEIRVEVIDTGIGISQESQSVVFERFRQADGSSTRRAGGTGLGLAISRQLLQMHGGEIYLTSEPGVGSTFSFTLPVLQAEPVSNGKVS